MAKKDLVIFSLDVLLALDGTFVPGADTIIGSDAFLKAFIASEKDNGFTWAKIAKLNSSGRFSGHCIPNTESEDSRRYILANMIGWIFRQHEVNRKFLIVRNEADMEHDPELGLINIKVDGPGMAAKALFSI